MPLGTQIRDAELHRAAYVAILNSALQEHGAKQRLARALGVTPNYISDIRKTDVAPDLTGQDPRVPSEELTLALVNTIELSAQQKAALLYHILAYRSLTQQSVYEVVDTHPAVSPRRIEQLSWEAYGAAVQALIQPYLRRPA